jgi:hypothetical protein
MAICNIYLVLLFFACLACIDARARGKDYYKILGEPKALSFFFSNASSFCYVQFN